jgi:hypothetical protein
MRKMKSIVLGIAVAAIIFLAAIPAVSAFAVANSQSTTLTNDNSIALQITGLNSGDQFKFEISSPNQQTSGGTVTLPSVTVPFALQQGSATETLTTSGVTGASMTISRNDGSAVILTGASFTSHDNIYKDTYSLQLAGTQTSSQINIDFSVNGTISNTPSLSGASETLSVPLSGISGIITINVYNGGTSPVFTQTYTIVPAGSVQQTVTGTTTTTTSGNPATIITNPITAQVTTGGVSSTLVVPASTEVASGSSAQVTTLYVAPVTAAVPASTFSSSGTTFAFAGKAVECGPSGTQFSGGSVTLSFTLTPSEWASAVKQANGDTAGITIRYYDAPSNTWISVPTTFSVGASSITVTAQITHFTTFGVFSQAPTPDLSASGGGSAAAAPAAAAPAMLAPVGYSATAVTLSHDANGVVSQDYTIETDPAAGFSSAVGISKGTQVISGTGQPVGEVSATPLPPGTPNASFSRGGSTFVFSGFSVGCEPAGTRFVGGNATISFSLTPSQWAAALGQVDGNTAAMTIQNYNNVSNTWLPVATTVNTDSHTVSAQITHFSTYAMFYQVTPQTVSTSAPTVASQSSQAVGASEPGATPIATMLAPPETTQSPGDQGIVGNFVQWVQHLVSH